LEKNTNFFERLHLFCESEGIKNMQELSKLMNYSSAEKLYRLERDPNNNPSYQMIIDLSNKFEYLNMNWIITGEGAMRKNITKSNLVNEQAEVYELKTDLLINEPQLVPLYNIEASAGIVTLFKDSSQNTPVDYIQIPNLPKCDGAVYITGDSMYPLLKSGDIVMYKQIQNIQDGIFWGEMYLISIDQDGDEMVLVKYVQKSQKGDDWIKLVSQNQHHQDKDVKTSKVRALALIKASIRINSMS
jgi:phage repressor protein C with HTH and peptisase S24 domain